MPRRAGPAWRRHRSGARIRARFRRPGVRARRRSERCLDMPGVIA